MSDDDYSCPFCHRNCGPDYSDYADHVQDEHSPGLMRHRDHDPSLICRPAFGNGLCEPLVARHE